MNVLWIFRKDIIMKKSDLLQVVKYKPLSMECCKECNNKKKDCEPNPLNCIDFCIFNYEKLKELGLIN